MKKLLLLSGILLLSTQVYAYEGQDKGNGGDICENKFNEVRDDISLWLNNGGAKNLKLEKSISHSVYQKEMLKKINAAKVSCTKNKLFVGQAEKTCKNFIDKGIPRIVCNSILFLETPIEEQYVLVHHEYAGLAGFEVNNGDESSNYKISNQLSENLEEKVVKKLAIKTEETLESKALKKFLADANKPNTKLGATLQKINNESVDGRNQNGIISFPVTRNDIKIVALTYEENRSLWHYGQLSENKKICTAPGDSAQYLILLSTNRNYRRGSSKDAINFTIDVNAEYAAKAKNNSVIENCEDITENPDQFIDLPTKYTFSPFKLINVSAQKEE